MGNSIVKRNERRSSVDESSSITGIADVRTQPSKTTGIAARVALGISALLATLVLAACGNDTGGANGGGDQSDQKALKWAQCMRANGVDMPDPGSNGLGKPAQAPPPVEDQRKAEKAAQVCKEFAPQNNATATDPAVADKNARYDQCLRDHGIDVKKDPSSGTSLVDESDKAKLDKAVQECGSIRK